MGAFVTDLGPSWSPKDGGEGYFFFFLIVVFKKFCIIVIRLPRYVLTYTIFKPLFQILSSLIHLIIESGWQKKRSDLSFY